jgi:hypothetical protein
MEVRPASKRRIEKAMKELKGSGRTARREST